MTGRGGLFLDPFAIAIGLSLALLSWHDGSHIGREEKEEARDHIPKSITRRVVRAGRWRVAKRLIRTVLVVRSLMALRL